MSLKNVIRSLIGSVFAFFGEGGLWPLLCLLGAVG